MTRTAIATSTAHRLANESIPIADLEHDSWVYDAVVELAAQGFFPAEFVHSRPMSRGVIAAELRRIEIEKHSLTVGQQVLVERLSGEYHEEIGPSGSPKDRPRIRLGSSVRPQTLQEETGQSTSRLGLDARAALALNNSTVFRVRIRLDTDGELDSQHRGRKWKGHYTGVMDNATVKYHRGNIEIVWGRDFVRWGPSRNDALLLSSHSPPFNLLRAAYRLGRFRLAYLTTRLDDRLLGDGRIAKRYLAAHRIEWRPDRRVTIAASEMMLYGGVDRSWELYYLNPILPYYWVQINEFTDDNPLWNLELTVRPTDGVELYGELLIDDFQIDFISEPQQVGAVGGVRWAPGWFGGRLYCEGEYERINTFVYGQRKEWNRYYHLRDATGGVIPIGAELETDADRVTIRTVCHIDRRWDTDVRFRHRRRGEDRIEVVQPPGGQPKGVPFPSGVVERETSLKAGALYQIGGQLIARFEGGWVWQGNVGHVRGLDRDGGFVRAQITAKVWRTVPL